MRLKEFNYSFLGATKPLPSEGLTIPVTINEDVYEIRKVSENMVRCVRKDGKKGDYKGYVRAAEDELGVPEDQRQIL